MRVLIFITFLFYITAAYTAPPKKKIAVLKFTTTNAEKAYATIIRNRLEYNFHKTARYELLERNKVNYLIDDFKLSDYFSIEEIEMWIYRCPSNKEQSIFNPILDKISSASFEDLKRFNKLFYQKLFPHVPQKILCGLSPVKYTLMLKRMSG